MFFVGNSHMLAKVETRVRFPSPAPFKRLLNGGFFYWPLPGDGVSFSRDDVSIPNYFLLELILLGVLYESINFFKE